MDMAFLKQSEHIRKFGRVGQRENIKHGSRFQLFHDAGKLGRKIGIGRADFGEQREYPSFESGCVSVQFECVIAVLDIEIERAENGAEVFRDGGRGGDEKFKIAV